MHTCSYYCDRPNCIKRQRDELREALFAAKPAAVPEELRKLAALATDGDLFARVIERNGNIVDAFLTVPSVIEGESVAGEYPMGWLSDDSYQDDMGQKAHDARFTAAAVNYVRAMLVASPQPECLDCAYNPGCCDTHD